MTFWFLAVLASVTHALGDWREPNYAFLTAVCLGFLWRSCPGVPGWKSWINWLFRWSTWAAVVGLLAWLPQMMGVVLVTAAVWAFDRYGPEDRRGQKRPLVVVGTLFALWWAVFFQLPMGYRWLLEWSFPYTHFLSEAMSARLWLGPSASAVDLLILGLAGVAAFTVVYPPRRWTHAIVYVVLLEAARILYIWMAPTLESILGRAIRVATTPHLDMPAVYFLFVAAVLVLLERTIPAQVRSPESIRTAWRSRWAVAGIVGVLAACLVASAASYTDRPVRVLFLNQNTLDTGVPRHGSYGDRSGGMFGFLTPFLQASGDIVYTGKPTKELLDSVDVIFISNLLEKLPEDDRQTVWDWVERGGAILIVGDHTGTEAIRDPTNDLLSPCGLEINFDTAVPIRRSWASAKSYLFHPAGRSGGVMDAELWLGASVTPGPRGEPFIIGRGAFSDPGDLTNKARSFLGNLSYDPGEPLGDVVLAAAAHWGEGKAILHGDTSPYQNGTMVRSHTLINRSLRWLARDGFGDFIDRWRDWLLIMLLAGLGTLLVMRCSREPALLAAALLIPTLSLGLWSTIPGGINDDWSGGEYRQALIDEGHAPLFDGMAWEDESIGGLQYNLMRNGYSPRFAESPLELDKTPAQVYVIATPSVPFNEDEIDRLERFAEQGGWVLLSAGWENREAVHALLGRFGLALVNVPLGKAEGVAAVGPVKMADAYPLSGSGDGIEVLVEAFGNPVAKIVKKGKGGLVAIGDSQFLLNKNLEGQNEFVVMENVRFFNQIMNTTAGVTNP